MKKRTVTAFLDKLESQAQCLKDESLRTSQLDSLRHCRTWLSLTWAEMLPPVEAKLGALTKETKPLIEKEEKQTLSSEESIHLQRVRATYTIYYQFYKKVYPTAHHAFIERSIRKQEGESRSK